LPTAVRRTYERIALLLYGFRGITRTMHREEFSNQSGAVGIALQESYRWHRELRTRI
jgi:hypothetical protein